MLNVRTLSALSLDLNLREYRGSVSSMLFGTFKLDFRHGDLSFCDGCVSASENESRRYKYSNGVRRRSDIKSVTFDCFHRAHHVRLLDRRTPVVNFGIRFARRITFGRGVRFAFAFCRSSVFNLKENQI